MKKSEALEIAKVHNIEKEVSWCIEACGYTPEDALTLCGLI